jgi:hypothetical protein
MIRLFKVLDVTKCRCQLIRDSRGRLLMTPLYQSTNNYKRAASPNIPAPEFDAVTDGDKPVTVTALAEMGKSESCPSG